MGQQRRVGGKPLAPVVARPGEPVVIGHHAGNPGIKVAPVVIVKQGVIGLGPRILQGRRPCLVPPGHHFCIQPLGQPLFGRLVHHHRLPGLPIAQDPILYLGKRLAGGVGLRGNQVGQVGRLSRASLGNDLVVQRPAEVRFCVAGRPGGQSRISRNPCGLVKLLWWHPRRPGIPQPAPQRRFHFVRPLVAGRSQGFPQ